MYIHCLGLNHTTAQVHLREKLAFNDDQVRAALARLGCGGWQSIAELLILSTCNRIEIYAVSSYIIFDELEIFLSETRRALRSEFHPHLYHLKDLEAVRHLYEVAAGLDSQVIGEPQILGQITHALEQARGQNTAGPVLNRLFQDAIHAGKRARSETAISQNPASISSLAAALAERAVHPLTDARVVLLGAGEMAELAVEALRKRGARHILVVNRTLERVQALAARWDAEAATFESIDEALYSADILIASTGAPHTVLTLPMVEQAMHRRAERPLVLIDIAVPRDIDTDIAHLPNVRLFDIDELSEQLEHSLAGRLAQVPRVRAILEEEMAGYGKYLKSLEMLPLIANLRQQAEAIRQAELDKTLRRLPDLTDGERARIEALTLALTKKLLEAPTNRLRAEAACTHAPEYATVARSLFGLEPEDMSCSFSGRGCPTSAPASD
jgi:glutamyl-tRNA reductase